MKNYELTSLIRAPYLNTLPGGSRNFVSRELSWAIDNRLLEMQTWLYQPFLYYLIHVGGLAPVTKDYSPESPQSHRNSTSHITDLLNPYPNLPQSQINGHDNKSDANSSQLDAEDIAVLRAIITSGIECNLKTIDVRSLRHRHHGLWYDLRSTMCASLILLGVVKSGNEAWIPGGVEELWGPPNGIGSSRGATRYRPNTPIGGRLRKVLNQFEFWSMESPDLVRHKEMLEAVIRDVRGS